MVLSAEAALGGQPGLEARLSGPELDERVATIGHRLAVSNLAWCREREWLPGVTLGVENPGAANRQGRRQLHAIVLALARGGPAARGGLAANDLIETADGAPLPFAMAGRGGAFTGMEQVRVAFEAAFSDGSARLGLRRAGAPVALQVAAEQGCASRFLILPSGRLNAFANGRTVQVTSRLAEETPREDELAAILAHEFAHHVLGHRSRLDASGVSRGVLRNFGRNARLIRAAEAEADRLSIWLLARAGYDPGAAVRFWTWFGRRGFNMFGDPTHGGWRARVARLEAEIAAMRAAGPDGRPDFLPPVT